MVVVSIVESEDTMSTNARCRYKLKDKRCNVTIAAKQVTFVRIAQNKEGMTTLTSSPDKLINRTTNSTKKTVYDGTDAD